MAKRKSPPKEKKSYLHEIFGIISFTLGAFVFLCLFSYSPSDPSLNSASLGRSVHNYGGIVGSYLADALLSGLGMASFLVGALLILGAYFCFTKSRRRIRLPEVVLLGVFLVMTAVLFQLNWNMVSLYGNPTLAGGLLGAVVGEHLRAYLSEVGSYLLVSAIGLLAFVWATKISLMEIFKGIWKLLVMAFQALQSMAVIYKARLGKWLGKRRAARELRVLEKAKEAKLAPQPVRPPKINLRKTEEKPLSPRPAPVPSAPVQEMAPSPLPRSMVEPQGNSSPGPKIFQRVQNKIDTKKNDQLTFGKFSGDFQLPSTALLDPVPKSRAANVDEESLKVSSVLLENKLNDYNVEGRVTEIHPGPVVTMYEFKPAAGVKVNKITNLVDDLSLSMGGRSVRIVAPLPSKPAVAIEIPKTDREGKLALMTPVMTSTEGRWVAKIM